MPYSNNASDVVFDYLTQQISSGRWLPNTRIDTEESLCETLSVSRAAIRQAIGRLSALKVLTKIQGSGTYVNPFEESSLSGLIYYPPTVERMLTVLEFREQFDSYNAALFVKKANDEELRGLAENYEAMCACKEDAQAFMYYENDFHQRIAEGTHNVIIRQTADTLTELLIRYQGLQYGNIGPENSIIWHGRILEAITKREADMAALCVKTHLRYSIEYILEHHSSPDEILPKNE